MTKIKIYDFDKTLAEGDSIMTLIKFARENKIASALAIYFKMAGAALKFALGFKIEKFKTFAAWLVNKFDDQELEAYVKWHLENYGYGNLIKEINEEGYLTILCSASLERYIEIAGRQMGFDYTIATKHDGKKVLGKNNCKEEKLRRLEELFAREKIEVDYENSMAFTDSVRNDKWMCQPCKQKFLVNDGRSFEGFTSIVGKRG